MVLRFQDWSKPINSQKLPGAKGSRNLCLVDGKIALIAREGEFDYEKTTSEQGDWFVTVLDASNGASLNCIKGSR